MAFSQLSKCDYGVDHGIDYGKDNTIDYEIDFGIDYRIDFGIDLLKYLTVTYSLYFLLR